jgi:hypothetical protein
VIRTLRPDTHVICLPSHITEETLPLLTNALMPDTVLWDCTDDARIQRSIYTLYKRMYEDGAMYLKYRKIGYEGFKIGTYSNFDIWFTNEDAYQPGYRTTSANVMSSAVAAALGIFAQGLGAEDDVNMDLRKLIIKEAPDAE